MLRRQILLCVLSALILPVGSCKGGIVFSDKFDNEPVATSVNDYSDFQNWDVTKGTVDILRYDPAFWFAPTTGGWDSSDGLFVDMGGFESGKIETKDSFLFTAGTYQLTFTASGNLRFRNDILRVTIGDYFTKDYYFPTNTPKTQFTETFVVTNSGLTPINFENFNDDPSENVGVILDDIQIINLTAVPEPASIALFSLGSVGIGIIARRRKKQMVL